MDKSGNLSTVVNATVLDYSTNDYTICPVTNGWWTTVWANALYAQWTANKYDVTLKPNGGSGSDTVKTVTYDQQPDEFNTHSRDGYTLTGYYTENGTKIINPDGTLVENVSGYTENGNWKKAADTELYAQWENIAGTQTISIKATYVSQKIQEVVSVDVSWGNME